MKSSLVRQTVFFLVGANFIDGSIRIPHVLASQVQAIQDLGWQIHLICIDDRTSFSGILRNLINVIHLKQLYKPAIVHASYGTMIAAIARVISGSLPLIVTFCGDDLLGTPNAGLKWRIREKLGRMLSLWAASGAEAITVMSENLLDVLPPSIQVKVLIIPWGVDLRKFFPMPKEDCRRTLAWGDNQYYVGINGSINDNQAVKNIQLAQQVIKTVSNSWKPVNLKIISTANLEEVRLFLNAVDCLLVTSLHEGSPNIIKEAMACNLPVVSVPCGDVRQRLDGVTPSCVSTYQVADLAIVLTHVLGLNVRSNGREALLAQNQDVSSIALQISQIYSGLLKA
jgi:glycosyltransferase involved in cell wall biosynthesis